MKKFKISILTILINIFLVSKVQAQNIGISIPNPSKFSSLEDIINALGSFIQPLFLLTFTGIVLAGSIDLLVSRGDAAKIAKARNTFVSGIIGFSLAVLAPTIVSIFTSLIGVDGFKIN